MLNMYLAMLPQEEQKKFNLIFEQYKHLVYNYAYGLLKDRHLAEDAVQRTFSILIESLQKVNEPICNKTRNYLIIISRNECYKIFNDEKKYVYEDLQEEVIADTYDIELETESRDTQIKIMEMIKSMDKKYADVLMLKFFHEYSDKEIAQALNITPENVRVRINRGRNKLKAMIKEAFFNDESRV